MKKKVIHIQKLAGVGGAEKHLGILLPGLVAEGLEIHYLVIEPKSWKDINEPFLQTLAQQGVHIHRLQLLDSIGVLNIPKLKTLLDSYPIIHSHLIHGDLWASLLKKKGQQLISTKHGYDEKYQSKWGLNPEYLNNHKNIYQWICRQVIPAEDKIICISQGLKNIFIALGAEPHKIKLIHYGYTIPTNYPQRKSPEYWLFLSRLIPFKRPDLLADTYIQYRKSGGKLPLYLAGDGILKSALQKQFQAAGLNKEVHFLGRLPDPIPLLSKAAGLIITSTSEGFGLVALEAMAAGIPVLGFDVPAINESVVSDRNGYLVPFPNTDLLSQALLKTENNNLREQLGDAGRNRVSTVFSTQKMISETLELYSSLRP